MAIPYLRIIRQVMIRANLIKDSLTNADLETNYTGTVANMFNPNNADISPIGLRDTILASEKKIVELIANDKNGIYRVAFTQRSNDIASGNYGFNQSDAGTEFIGIIDGVFDSQDNQALTEKTVQEVARYNENPDISPIRPYHFAKVGARIFHTRDDVFQQGCAWSYANQTTSYNTGADSPMPQALEAMWVADVLVNLIQETWKLNVAGDYKTIYEECKANLHRTNPQMPSLPDNTANAEPIKN